MNILKNALNHCCNNNSMHMIQLEMLSAKQASKIVFMIAFLLITVNREIGIGGYAI